MGNMCPRRADGAAGITGEPASQEPAEQSPHSPPLRRRFFDDAHSDSPLGPPNPSQRKFYFGPWTGSLDSFQAEEEIQED